MTLFYLDIDSFFCAVTAAGNPALKKRPFVVSHQANTARVLSASPLAKREGIRRGEPLSSARKKVTDLQTIVPDFARFDQASRIILTTLGTYSPRIEPRGYGRFVLDMSGMQVLHPRFIDTTRTIQRDIQQRTQLYAHAGIAENKLVGAIAAKESQLRHEDLMFVPNGDESRFLAPLPCRALPEWRYRRIREHLRDLNLSRIAHIQLIPRPVFCLAIGAFAADLHEHAFGIDFLPVTPPARAETLTASHTFSPPTNHDRLLKAELFHLVEQLGFKLRQRHLGADDIRMFIRFRDGLNRRKTYKFPFCQNDLELYQAAKHCFQAICNRRQAISQIAISLRGLAPFHQQLELFPTQRARHDSLQASLDTIRQRFGPSSIRYALPC